MSISEIVNGSANWLTFIGFIITVFTFIGVITNKKQLNKLNKKNYSINRLPENLEDLKTISRSISIKNADFDNFKRELVIEINKILPILKSLKKSLNSTDFEHFEDLKKHVKKIKNIVYNENEISAFRKLIGNFIILDENYTDNTYRLLTVLITDIENIQRDNRQNLL